MAVRRAAVIGCGDVAAVHFEALETIEDIELVAVCDTDPHQLSAAQREHGVPGYASHEELLAKERLDVVHVTTPHDQHVQASIDALAAGVNVIQEKPIAHTLAEGQRLVDAAAGANAKIGICFQNRYNVSSVELRRLIDSGDLGEFNGAYASVVWMRSPAYYQARPWRGQWARAGGGLLINQAIHTLDLVQWLFGGVTTLTGHAASRRYGDVSEVEDTAEILLEHPDGRTTAFYGTLAAPQHRPVEIEADFGNAYAVVKRGLKVRWKDGQSRDKYPERTANSGGRSYWGVSHELLIRDFYDQLDSSEPFWITPDEAMKSLRILKEVYRQSGFDAPQNAIP
ncbi:Gfo/Idh/MocA family protein [Nigerium massiliense]|uniref:Gfo/Idh/MocA family protein n=1 Tax=Nigerium massiliense TaxID=1522317 RepID=UPI00058DA670|nr:Gfo/Idh/MocA family oxidoreductase [Nigerium massiliense]